MAPGLKQEKPPPAWLMPLGWGLVTSWELLAPPPVMTRLLLEASRFEIDVQESLAEPARLGGGPPE